MKFNFPAAPQLSRQQTMLAGGGIVVVIAAAVAAFLLLQPKGEPEASADTGVSAAARAKAARDSAIARRARMNAGAVAQAGSATTSTVGKPAAKGAALKTAAASPAPASPASPASPATKEAPKPAASPAVAAAPEAKKDTGVVIQREEFAYESEGRRDPFFSLMTSQDLRPGVADLRLSGILWHPTRPIAVLRELTGNQQYRVTVGSTLGRMRVTQIRPKAVIFTIEEFGFSRRDSLILGDTTQVRAR